MAKSTSSTNGQSLVIVESPAKARTIAKFLGSEYVIEASIGHIRDLPKGAGELPEKFRSESWSYLGVNVDEGFEPVYVVPKDKSGQVRKLRDMLKGASQLYLATDEDREGEAISWHLCQVLNPKVPVRRLVFHEITREAILEALEHPRDIDDDLVRAQEVRRIVDRLYGYDVSPLLWRKIKPKLSAGRVQSVAVRLIVEREKARMAFRSATYWDVLGTFVTQKNETFQATLVSVGGLRIPTGRDFDSATGNLIGENCLLLGEEEAGALLEKLRSGDGKVEALEDKPYTSKPYAPFTTSTLQQEANRKHGFTARRTMQAAQSLYENGHITYMRTDSTNLADVAVQAAREHIRTRYGEAFLTEKPRVYRTKVKNAQEAHEAIRPAGHPFPMPDSLKGRLSSDEFKLYDLIWKRTIACQMADARGHRITLTAAIEDALFQVSGKTIEFPGYLRAYVEGSDDPSAELADQEVVLPTVAVGEPLRVRNLEAKDHTTKPPGRYSEASLTRALEEMGIGRPSTYASIIETIIARDYVFKLRRTNILIPTWTAFAVSQLLEQHLPDLVDYQFTAEMEDELDAISRGEMDHVEYLKAFYYGNSHPGLRQQLEHKVDTIDAREVCQIRLGSAPTVPAEGEAVEAGASAVEEDVYVRVGRYGPYLQHGERRASLREDMPPDEMSLEAALELLEKAQKDDEPLGECPETGRLVYLKTGRFGPYVQLAPTEDSDEKPKNASLLKGMNPEDVNLQTAILLLSFPKSLGPHPESGEPVMASDGRYGPYIKHGSETRSLPPDVSLLEVTFEKALELLAQPKRGRGAAQKKEPIKTFDPSPVTEKPIQLLDGRYGPYVTDGTTNASLPRDMDVEEVTFQVAVDLLKARAEKGSTQRTGKKTTKKTTTKATKKKTVKKTAKKAAKRKTAKAVAKPTTEQVPFE